MMNIPIQGISISQTDEVIHIQSEGQLVTFSSAIIGGGLSHVRHIINAHVDKTSIPQIQKTGFVRWQPRWIFTDRS